MTSTEKDLRVFFLSILTKRLLNFVVFFLTYLIKYDIISTVVSVCYTNHPRMENVMETKRNIKYFTAPFMSVPTIVGWAIVLIGVIFMIIGQQLMLAGVLTGIVGLAVIIITSGGKSTDTDIEFQISQEIRDLQEQSEKHFEVYEKSFLKQIKPVNLRGYNFEAKKEPFYYKKGQDGMNRTNYFKGANLIFTSEKMFVYGKDFSLTDSEANEVFAEQFFFNELEKATVEEKVYTYKKKDADVNVKYYVFSVLKTDGTPALEMCVDYGADIDTYVEQISRAIVTRKKELEKRAAETEKRRAEFRAKVEAERAAIARGEMREDE